MRRNDFVIAKTRGTGMRPTAYGPRGKRVPFVPMPSPTNPWSNASGCGYSRFAGPDISKVSAGQYALGLASVAALMFVIGYSLEKGKDIA